jgi:hypothetical protein
MPRGLTGEATGRQAGATPQKKHLQRLGHPKKMVTEKACSTDFPSHRIEPKPQKPVKRGRKADKKPVWSVGKSREKEASFERFERLTEKRVSTM